jgi:hypothetical protein
MTAWINAAIHMAFFVIIMMLATIVDATNQIILAINRSRPPKRWHGGKSQELG